MATLNGLSSRGGDGADPITQDQLMVLISNAVALAESRFTAKSEQKFGEVKAELGEVKSELGEVKSDLAVVNSKSEVAFQSTGFIIAAQALNRLLGKVVKHNKKTPCKKAVNNEKTWGANFVMFLRQAMKLGNGEDEKAAKYRYADMLDDMINSRIFVAHPSNVDIRHLLEFFKRRADRSKSDDAVLFVLENYDLINASPACPNPSNWR